MASCIVHGDIIVPVNRKPVETSVVITVARNGKLMMPLS